MISMHGIVLLFGICALPLYVDCHGCIPTLCASNPSNELRACPDRDGTCGAYMGKRFLTDRRMPGVDILCTPEQTVNAPFDGQLTYWRPLGSHPDHQCLDKGVRIDGTGQWLGYYALIAYVEPDVFGDVRAGQPIGRSVQIKCDPSLNGDFQNYIQIRLYRRGTPIDPTFHVHDCMCTGQICESNPTNALHGSNILNSMTDTPRYGGVRGYELQCPMMRDTKDAQGNMLDPEQVVPRTAVVYAPIDGKFMGRIRMRVNAENHYTGCDNDGIVVEGRSRWEDYTVRIYNVRYRDDFVPGKTNIVQGQPIGHRLTCTDSPDTIFVQFQFTGRFIDLHEQLAATNCSVPQRYT